MRLIGQAFTGMLSGAEEDQTRKYATYSTPLPVGRIELPELPPGMGPEPLNLFSIVMTENWSAEQQRQLTCVPALSLKVNEELGDFSVSRVSPVSGNQNRCHAQKAIGRSQEP